MCDEANTDNIQNTGSEYAFSVIVPVYKTEEYLEETIKSIINQSIGFTEHIQLILVNNATPDNAADICHRYQQAYPNNVVYVDLPENRGPSGARNAGISFAKGEYVNFLDSDDKWASDAFEHAYAFLETHKNVIPCAICRKKYFEAWGGWFFDDKIFSGTRVCNIFAEPENPQFWIGSTFFHHAVLTQHSFDEKAQYSEDMKLLNEIILENGNFGIVREAVFYYRKRISDNLSQVQMQRKARYWYFDALKNSYFYFVELSKWHYGYTIPYIQCVLMQEIAWRITQRYFPEDFSEEDFTRYREMLKMLITEVDDFILLTQSNLWKEYKIYCLKLKYGKQVEENFELRKKEFIFQNIRLFWRDEKQLLTVLSHEMSDSNLRIEIRLNIPLSPESYTFYFKDNDGNHYSMQRVHNNRNDNAVILGEILPIRYRGIINIPVTNKEIEIFPCLLYKNIEFPCKMQYATQERLNLRLKNSYCQEDGFILLPSEQNLRLIPESRKSAFKYEKAVIKELIVAGHKRALVYRILSKWLSTGEKSWVLILDKTPDLPEHELQNRKVAIVEALKTKPDNMPVWLICPKEEFEWASLYATPIDPTGLRWAQIVFCADAVLSFNWNQTKVFGWHTDLVKDLLHFKCVDLNDSILDFTKNR